MIKETWKLAKGFEESGYEVSDLGKLRRKTKNGYKYQKLSTKDKDGYIKASMNKDGKRHHLRIHRIVAENFITNPENKPVVNHINGIKGDNRASNLEWNTVAENTQHAYDHLGRIGQNGGTNKNVTIVYDSGEKISFSSQTECARYLGVSASSLGQNINRDIEGIKKRKRKYTIVRDCEGVTTKETAN